MPDRMHEEVLAEEKGIEERVLVVSEETPAPVVEPKKPVVINPIAWVTSGVKGIKSTFNEWLYLQN